MEEDGKKSQNETQKMTFKESTVDRDETINIQETKNKEELEDSDSHSDTPPLAR